MSQRYRILACLVVAAVVAPALAKRMAPPPVILRAGQADLVVVGKVTGYAPKMVKAEMFKGDTRDMQIALVEVNDTLLGKAGKKIEVGFFPPSLPRRSGINVELKQGAEVLLMVTKHPTKKGVYMAQDYSEVVTKADKGTFDNALEEAKKATKLMAKPMDGLKSKDADERLLTSALLIGRYRRSTGSEKTEEVSADESKLILETLAGADWASRNPKFGPATNPQGLFFQLGVTDKDGWNQPKDFRKLQEEAKKWCKDNAGKYRIKRYVAEEK